MIAAVAAQLRSQASVEQFAEPSSRPPSLQAPKPPSLQAPKPPSPQASKPPLNALLKAQPAG